MKQELTAEAVRKVVAYDPETGAFTWLPRDDAAFNAHYAGKPALISRNADGYRKGRLFYSHLLAHRVAWLHYYGEFPRGVIDHINGDPADNRIANLRDVTATENARNARRSRANTSGAVGVIFNKGLGKWVAQIHSRGVHKYLGCFNEFDDALAARMRAAQELGYHANHGRAAP